MRLFQRHTAAAIAAAAILGFGGTVEAAPISWDITYDPDDVLVLEGAAACTGDVLANTSSGEECTSLQFVYTLDPFNTGTDFIESGSVTLSFYDDASGSGDSGGRPEIVSIVFDGATASGSPFTIFTGGAPYVSPALDVTAFLGDGQLTVLLGIGGPNDGNDFYFASARLIASGERIEDQEEEPPPTGGVPEPTSLLLFGMAGLAARRVVRRAN
jgi:hypothetical protein